MLNKKILRWTLAVIVVVAIFVALAMTNSRWEGVDTAVVGKYAAELGRAPQTPYVNLQGDTLLFAFTVAGAAGGFALGYYWRILFAKPARPVDSGLSQERES